MARVSASSWGVRFPALRLLYIGTYIATITYAAAVWYRRAAFTIGRNPLLRSQRSPLILLTKAYRSVSTAALPVLAGVLPADLEVMRAGRSEEERAGLAGEEHRKKKREIHTEAVKQWQERWESHPDGRELYSFFPSVAERLDRGWVEPDYMVSQLLTGHGCFRGRLWALKLSITAECFCGDPLETRDHILWKCVLYGCERRTLLDGITRAEAGPVYFRDLESTAANFAGLRDFARAWHAKRVKLELEE